MPDTSTKIVRHSLTYLWPNRMTPHEFIPKWQAAKLSERSACQQHFLDLCELLNQPKPAAADPDGAFYTFERGVRVAACGQLLPHREHLLDPRLPIFDLQIIAEQRA